MKKKKLLPIHKFLVVDNGQSEAPVVRVSILHLSGSQSRLENSPQITTSPNQ
jgi:hypothetical protein